MPDPVDGSAAEGQFAVVERGLTIEGGHGEVPLPTFPAHGFVSVEGVSVLLDQVTEYEVVDGRELALTLLRSFGLISRNANPYREDPAGPEVPVPAAQLLGERASSFAILPHRGGWLGAGTADWAERYRHPVLAVRGVGPAASAAGDGAWAVVRRRPARRRRDADRPASTRGLARAAGRSPPAGRRPGPHPAAARERRRLEARDADLLGRAGAPIAVDGDEIAVSLTGWEIRTLQLRTVGGP